MVSALIKLRGSIWAMLVVMLLGAVQMQPGFAAHLSLGLMFVALIVMRLCSYFEDRR